MRVLKVLYKVAGDSYKEKEYMPKEIDMPVSIDLGLYRRCITLSLFGGALSLMNVYAQFSSMIIVRFIFV